MRILLTKGETMSELLTTVDVGKMAGITHAGVAAATNRGEIQAAARTPGGRLLYTRAEAERYTKARLARIEKRGR
jgi:hypothetical protein